MANYNLVLDTKFKPFSYQEMLAPVMAATQAHQALEEEYGNLGMKASVWEEMANEQTDPYAYKMYKTYANDLEMKAEQLARNGLSPASRKDMLGMRARYSKEIVPIETAYKRREELAAEQRKAIAANPTLRYQRIASQMSLDDFIKNPSLDYGESYSGALLTQQVSQAAANFQRALTDKGQLKKLGLPYQYERMLQYGATPAQVMAAMSDNAQQGDTDAIKFLRGITDQVLQSSGVADWADPATMREFRAFANQGLYSAIGQAKIDTFKDDYGANIALANHKAALARAAKSGNDDTGAGRLPYRRISGLSVNAKQNRISREDLEFLKKVKANPQMIRKVTDYRRSSSTYIGAPGAEAAYAAMNANASSVPVYGNLERLRRIQRDYGINILAGDLNRAQNKKRYAGDNMTVYSAPLDQLINKVNKQVESSIVQNDIWQGNSTDNSWVVQGFQENLRATQSQRKHVDAYEINNGRISSTPISKDDLDKMSTKDASYYTYVDNKNMPHLIMQYTDTDGKRKNVAVGMSTVSKDLWDMASQVKSYMDKGDNVKASEIMDTMHVLIDTEANTRARTQDKSSNKVFGELENPYDNLVEIYGE